MSARVAALGAGAAHLLEAASVPCRLVQPLRGGKAPVAVHDEGDVVRNLAAAQQRAGESPGATQESGAFFASLLSGQTASHDADGHAAGCAQPLGTRLRDAHSQGNVVRRPNNIVIKSVRMTDVIIDDDTLLDCTHDSNGSIASVSHLARSLAFILP